VKDRQQVNVLDAGAGLGCFSRYIAAKVGKFSVYFFTHLLVSKCLCLCSRYFF
jgi:hypothetical protein